MSRRSIMSPRTVGLIALSLMMTACSGSSDVWGGDDPLDGPGSMQRAVTTIDPAVTTTTPLTELEPGCLSTVESTPVAPAVELLDDPLEAFSQDRVAPVPLPGHEDRVLVDLEVHTTIDEYFAANPNIIAPAERRALMEDGGFRGSVGAHFAHDTDAYSVYAIGLGSPAAAKDYFDEHVRRICRDAVGLRPLESPVGGFVYARELDGATIPRAVAVVDDVEITITVCRCVGVTDPAALAGQWLTAIVEQLLSPAPVPA